MKSLKMEEKKEESSLLVSSSSPAKRRQMRSQPKGKPNFSALDDGELPRTPELKNPFQSGKKGRRKSTGGLETIPFESIHEYLVSRSLAKGEAATAKTRTKAQTTKIEERENVKGAISERVIYQEEASVSFNGASKTAPSLKKNLSSTKAKQAKDKIRRGRNDDQCYRQRKPGKGDKKSARVTNGDSNPFPAKAEVPTDTANSSTMSFLQVLELENQKRGEKSLDRTPPPTKKEKAKKKTSNKKMHLSFLESLELENQNRKKQDSLTQQEDTNLDAFCVGDTKEAQTRRARRKQKKNIARGLTESIQEKLAQRQSKQKQATETELDDNLAMKEFEYDANMPQVDWLSMSVKDASPLHMEVDNNPQEEADVKKAKKTKMVRSKVEYAYPNYRYITRSVMQEPAYYLKMISMKRRKFTIANLFTDRHHKASQSPYSFNEAALVSILDPKTDKKWIRQWKDRYKANDDDSDGVIDAAEVGMEILIVFFGPNGIDQGTDSQDTNDSFSDIGSVESVHFDSDGEDDELFYNGRPRDKIEITPGNLSILRKEEETYDAIAKNAYMSSLCLGCGVALVSVQDAQEVACPNCGSITPLNGISLRRPFGIATGVKRVKCEHLLAPRTSPFAKNYGQHGAPSIK